MEYKTIPRFPGYRFGDDGSVWSSKLGEWAERKQSIRLGPSRSRYLKVTLYQKGGRHSSPYVHRLICEAFHGPPPPGQNYACHKDVDSPFDNRPDNLKWASKKESTDERRARGRNEPILRSVTGENSKVAVLNESQVKLIRHLQSIGKSHEHIARRFGVSGEQVSRICSRRSWKHVTEPWEPDPDDSQFLSIVTTPMEIFPPGYERPSIAARSSSPASSRCE